MANYAIKVGSLAAASAEIKAQSQKFCIFIFILKRCFSFAQTLDWSSKDVFSRLGVQKLIDRLISDDEAIKAELGLKQLPPQTRRQIEHTFIFNSSLHLFITQPRRLKELIKFSVGAAGASSSSSSSLFAVIFQELVLFDCRFFFLPIWNYFF